MKDKKIVFFGTPKFAAYILEGLIENGYHIIGVITQPDKPVGRKKILQISPVKEVALKYHLPVYQPLSLRKNHDFLMKMEIDLIITVAYGQILPHDLLEMAKINCINVHGSLLPKYRGGAPIQRAIMNGEQTTGITIMQMVDQMDAGMMYAKKEIAILENENSSELFDRLMVVGKELLLEVLPDILNGKIKGIAQNEEEVTFAYNIKREEEKIDFSLPVKTILNQIRGLALTPGAYCFYQDKQFKIYRASLYDSLKDSCEVGTLKLIGKNILIVRCLDGYLRLNEIQMEGKTKMDVSSFLNGVDKNTFLQTKLVWKRLFVSFY